MRAHLLPSPDRMPEDMPEDIPERLSKDMSDRIIECQKICPIECQKEGQKECQKICQKECQKECQSLCQTECQIECQEKEEERTTRFHQSCPLLLFPARKLCQKDNVEICITPHMPNNISWWGSLEESNYCLFVCVHGALVASLFVIGNFDKTATDFELFQSASQPSFSVSGLFPMVMVAKPDMT